MAKKKEATKTANVETKLRPAIVTIMGHVDHGKTSLLDAIREDYSVGAIYSKSSRGTKEKITVGESGGITQHIGAYSVEKDGKRLTFIDTPGHEAFTQMRARGGAAADVVILVVAADDGVMPQTKEAISHAKAAEVPIVVAINKSDLPQANPMRVKQQLAENGIAVEGFGGDIVAVEVSAIRKTNIDELLDVINLLSEMNPERLKADESGKPEAVIIESRHDPKRGIIVSAIVKSGTFNLRDEVFASGKTGRIKSMVDSMGNSLQKATLGDAIEILGFSDIPHVGDTIRTELVEESVEKEAEESEEAVGENSKVKKLNIIVRADTQGTQEAIVASINKLKLEDAVPHVLFAGTGEVKESDVLLASSGRAIIFAFKVRVPASIKDFALSKKVLVREHEIIYKLLEEIEQALEGVLEIEESKIKGRGLVIEKFTLPKSGMVVIGTLVEAGKFRTNNRVGIFRDDSETPLYVTRIRSIHIGTEEVNVANKAQECGLLFKPQIEDVQLEDRIEVL